MKECTVRIEIYTDDVDTLFEIEKLLRKVGVSFDTGYDLVEHRRDWLFDYSLKGAKVIFKEFKNGELAE